MNDKAEPHFDLDLAYGEIGEEQLKQILAGKIEVKRDRMAYKTGNLAIEYMYRGYRSGILNTKSPWWALILEGGDFDGDVILLMRAKKLYEYAKRGKKVKGGDNNWSDISLVRLAEIFEPGAK